jgi:hypothetical protein
MREPEPYERRRYREENPWEEPGGDKNLGAPRRHDGGGEARGGAVRSGRSASDTGARDRHEAHAASKNHPARARLKPGRVAAHYRIPIGMLRDWEQGRSEPDAPGRAYLWVIAKEPELVRRTLAQNGTTKRAAAV